MNYLEWNNIISQYFFNDSNAGRYVHLYLTKTDIIRLAEKHFEEETQIEIWDDFVKAIRSGMPGSSGNLISKARYAYEKRNLLRVDSIEVKYPPYISYLVFAVLPLIEGVDGTYSANNYYDRLNRFLKTNQINETIGTNDFRNSQINLLWEDLGHWANIKKNGDLGLFKVIPFTNSNWIYVGKIFSQCVFPPKAIKRLPELFLQAGLVPGLNYSSADIKTFLLHHGVSFLQLPINVVDTIRQSESNELGQSIIETVTKEYLKWTGEAHSTDEMAGLVKIRRNDVSTRLYLQFKLFANSGRIDFSFRLKSANEFPEDLKFDDNEVFEEKAGYSRTLNLSFKNTFQLKDEFNKWVAKFPDKSIRLFINAGLLQFSNDYWIETDTLSRTNWMYLLCENSKREIICKWLNDCCDRFEDETDYSGMPDGYSLFKFLNPKEGLIDVPELTILKDKNIRLVSALKYDFRTFTNDFLPEVEIVNSDGTEVVYLEYKNDKTRLSLNKKPNSNDRWIIPDNVSLYSNFVIKIEKEELAVNEVTYKIITSNESTPQLDENNLPKRDSFGWVTENESDVYLIGSNTVGSNLQKQLPYSHIFKSTLEDLNPRIEKVAYVQTAGNVLLSYLTLKETLTVQEFYSAFDLLHSKYLGNETDENFNYSKVKRVSINFLDYLGYLDYEYQTKSIVINPPQLVFVPASKGRRVLLIGGRNKFLVDSIIAIAPKYNLQVEITPQLESNIHLLLPDAITIRSFGSSKEGYGENNLIAFAKELNIKFNPSEFVQLGLREFCSDIENYKTNMFAEKETTVTYEDWARYVFSPEVLRLEKSELPDFDKSFSLLEYRLRPWEFHHRLWVNDKCFMVDKNWGQYIALKQYNKQVIRKGNGKVAIPISLPLPRLLAESILLCSGIAPATIYIDGIGYRVYENIHSIFIDNLFIKLGQTPVIDNSL